MTSRSPVASAARSPGREAPEGEADVAPARALGGDVVDLAGRAVRVDEEAAHARAPAGGS